MNSGFMLAQYTQAAMVAESKRLAVPASVDSIPTSGTTEDHVSMGWDAGRKALKAVANAEAVVSIEALLAAQALDLRAPLEPSRGVVRRARGDPGARRVHGSGPFPRAGHRRRSRARPRRDVW